MSQSLKVTVVMPAYNAETTLEKVVNEIPKGYVDEIILVDDCSIDRTVEIAEKLGIIVVKHAENQGYGANQKTCYTHAMKSGADLVINLHPDGQYHSIDIIKFIHAFREQNVDIILGSRFLAGGQKQTPLYKRISIQIITFLFNLTLGTNLSEVNTGYRAYSRKILERVPWNKNGDGYIFDPQFIIQAKYFGFNFSDVPIKKDYHESASSPKFFKSLHHGIENIFLLLQYILHRYKIIKADYLFS